MKIAFLGLGRMGRAMAGRVLGAGHELTVWNRTPGRAGELVSAGAWEASSVRDAVRGAEAVVVMLFGPESAREVIDEVLAEATPGTLLVNTTTIGPDAARELADTVAKAGLRYVDAPVLGTLGPAREGTLRVLVGASPDDAAAAEPVVAIFGSAVRTGGVGTASSLKLVVNLALGLSTSALGEAMRLGADLGIDRDVLLATLANGAVGFLVTYKKPMLESGDFSDAAFSVDAMLKDLRLAQAAANRELPLTAAAVRANEGASASGLAEHDFAAVIDHLAGDAD